MLARCEARARLLQAEPRQAPVRRVSHGLVSQQLQAAAAKVHVLGARSVRSAVQSAGAGSSALRELAGQRWFRKGSIV